MINRVASPVRVAAGRDPWARWRFECPVFRWIFAARGDHSRFRPLCPLINPRSEQTDLFGGERVLFFRHLRDVVADSGHGLNDEAFGALAWNQQRCGIAAFERSILLIQSQPGLLLLRPVTFETGRAENRLNVLCE